MKRISEIIVMIALLSYAGVSFGRETQDAVLVTGDPPLTRQMVNQLNDFFQWALDISLTPLQQKLLEKSVVETWTTKNKKEIDGTLELLKVRDQLAQATPAERDRAREQVQPEVLKSLRDEPNDETARMLLSAYESAHQQTAVENNQQTPSVAAVTVVGNWHTGSVSSINFYNPGTGRWAAPSGTGMSYEISANGHYVYSGLLQTSMYGCTTSFFTYETGTWSVQGSTINFSPTSGRAKSEDNCHQQFNYDRPKTPPKRSLAFSFKPTEYSGEEQLCLVESTGEICFRREASAK